MVRPTLLPRNLNTFTNTLPTPRSLNTFTKKADLQTHPVGEANTGLDNDNGNGNDNGNDNDNGKIQQ